MVMENFQHPGGFMFQFNIMPGYHHRDAHQCCQKYLDFFWFISETREYFVFTVLPFGLISVPNIFKKTIWPLAKFWKALAIEICCLIDDSLSTNRDIKFTQSLTSSQPHFGNQDI